MDINRRSASTAEQSFAASHYSNSDFEDEWEIPAAPHYTDPDSNQGFASEWEVQEASHYANSETEDEWEYEDVQGMRNTAQNLIPQARKLAAIAPKALGVTSSPPSQLLSALLEEGETAAVEMEAQFFGSKDTEVAIGNFGAAYEAALTDVLVAEATHSPNKAEAAALLGAAVPSAVKSMGAQRALLPAMLPLVQVVSQLAQIFRQSGVNGQKLQRLLPTVLRRVIASLQAARRAGKPIDSASIAQVTAAHVVRVLKDPTTLTTAIARNAMLRRQVVKPSKSSV